MSDRMDILARETEQSGQKGWDGMAGSNAGRHDPEVTERAHRRSRPAAYKLRILEEADACTPGTGELGALLRREGLYSSSLSNWRKQRNAGVLQALKPKPRGRKSLNNPLQEQIDELNRENARLKRRLEQAETIIEFQKKVCTLFDIPLATPDNGERNV